VKVSGGESGEVELTADAIILASGSVPRTIPGFDIDGKLVGNWFRAGSGGYPGVHPMTEGYWDGHLAIVPDGNDPAQIIVSVGNVQGSAQQFAVVGNRPDPATVDMSTGLVTYQLGTIETYSEATGQVWDGKTYVPHVRARAGSTIVGTVLLQLTDTRSLKVEVFPGKTAGEVRGFDSGALTYVR